MLTGLFAQVESMAPVRMIVTVPGLYPLVSALHILGICLLVGSIVLVDLRLLKVLGQEFDRALPTLVRFALYGFGLAASAGVLLVSVRIANYAGNPAFLAKIAIVAIAGCNAVFLRIVRPGGDLAKVVGSPWASACSALSLSLWISAILAGRWIAFV